MNTLKLLIKSRTVWTLVFMLAFNLFAVFKPELDPKLVGIVDAVFTTLAAYFKLNPSQNYNG